MSAHRNGGGTAHVGRAVVWWSAVLLAVLLLATAARLTYGGGPNVERVGTANVVSCVDHGPVGLHGLGTAYTCTADVRWDDGRAERRTFPAGQLAPADRGTAVPVYEDVADSRGDGTELGRNDTAAWSQVRVPLLVAGGFVVLVLAFGALGSTYRLFRTSGRPEAERGRRPIGRTRAAEQRRAARASSARWPVDPADVTASGTPKLAVRLYGLAVWCAVAVAYCVLATVPLHDAPRAVRFVSPMPEIEHGWLVDVPVMGVVIGGVVLVPLLFAMARGTRTEAARIVRYGPDYLGRDLRGKGSTATRVARRLDTMKRGEGTRLVLSYVIGAALLLLALGAAVRCVDRVPGGAPLPAWLAAMRDAVLVGSVALLWLWTVDSRYRRISALLDRHHRHVASSGPGTARSDATGNREVRG